MTLTIYDTCARKKVPFEPLQADTVKMYVCGPTVYNYVHIGNARPVVVFDTLFRVLKTRYPNVIYARNITDIDDKIIAAARDQKIEITSLAKRYAKEFELDMAALNTLVPTLTPYATDNLDAMIALVQNLVEKGHAYVADGHVLFDVKSMPDYGTLSNRSLDDMLAGARVEVAGYKKYAGDFVLWKPSTEEDPGWSSPWGRGRPGWHLECSAMIEKHLGNTIDIHGGGRDLIFPHHENERAQSECAHGGTAFVRHWMHNGYINIDGEKMSKSLGNFKTVRELLSLYPGEVLRFALLSANYRSELDFSKDLLEQSKDNLDTFYAALRKVDTTQVPSEQELYGSAAYQALLDDLNTPLAMSELHGYAKQINKNDVDLPKAKGMLVALGELMGVLQQDPEQWFQGGANADDEWIESMIRARQQAKIDKDYSKADEIRAELLSQGVVLEDSREGTKWRRDA